MRALAAALTVACLFAGSLAACGGNDDGGDETTASNSLDTGEIETALTEAFELEGEDAVQCPPEMERGNLSQTECSVQAKGKEGTVRIALLHPEGKRIHLWLAIGTQELEGEINVPFGSPTPENALQREGSGLESAPPGFAP